MNYILTIDAGSSSFKIVLFNGDGREVASISCEYELIRPTIQMAEIDLDLFWSILAQGIKDIIAKAKINVKTIKGLVISSQGETLIVVDKNGLPLRRAISWYDNRSFEEAQIIENEFGAETTYKVTGQPEIVPTWTATKILWLKKNEPDIFQKSYKFLLVEDYLIYKLTGKYVSEYSLYPSSLLFDITKKEWWMDMLKLLKISPEKFSTLKESGEIVGALTDEAAKEIGLTKETLVITGAFDQAAGCVGSGNILTGMITETTGSALAICATTDRPIFDPMRRVPCQYHAVPNKYYLMAWGQTAGMTLKWFRDEFSPKTPYTLMDEEAGKVSPGCEGLVMLPHIMGTQCPEFNNNARGVYFGISLKHKKAHFTRAILESVAFMLKKNIKVLEEIGIKVSEIRSLGGGARSSLWNKIKADVIERPILTLESEEAASIGVAILAGVGVGLYRNIEDGCNKMIHLKERLEPSPEDIEVYNKSYQLYLKIYDSLADVFPKQEE